VAALPALLAYLDTDERVRGRQWERICAWYLKHDPAYRSLLHRVWLWNEWPGRWGVDAGIDLRGAGRRPLKRAAVEGGGP
jgi:predicted helicase